MDALAERVEVLAAVGIEQDDFAVEDVAALGEPQFREVARERLAGAGPGIDVPALPEGDGAEPVPFGLVRPALARREVLGRAGELGEQWWLQRQRHGCLNLMRAVTAPRSRDDPRQRKRYQHQRRR